MKFKPLVTLTVIIAIFFAILWMRPVGKENVQMNNETCPVSGNPVKEGPTYVHEGKEYKLCSEECKEPLSKNPKKYLSKYDPNDL